MLIAINKAVFTLQKEEKKKQPEKYTFTGVTLNKRLMVMPMAVPWLRA